MNIEEYRDFCLSLPATDEATPFDEKTLVFRVLGKMFALTDMETFEFVNLKCPPETALELRETHPCVRPGFHMSKKHWNSVYFDGSVTDETIRSWIRLSYDTVVSGMTKKMQKELKEGLD